MAHFWEKKQNKKKKKKKKKNYSWSCNSVVHKIHAQGSGFEFQLIKKNSKFRF